MKATLARHKARQKDMNILSSYYILKPISREINVRQTCPLASRLNMCLKEP